MLYILTNFGWNRVSDCNLTHNRIGKYGETRTELSVSEIRLDILLFLCFANGYCDHFTLQNKICLSYEIRQNKHKDPQFCGSNAFMKESIKQALDINS